MAKKQQFKEPLLQRKLTLKEKVTWSPLKKYELFSKTPFEISTNPNFQILPIDKVPWKLIIHICLIIFTTLQVVALDDIYASHAREQKKVLNNLFLNSDSETNTILFYTIEDFKTQIGTALDNLRTIDDQLFQKVANKDQIMGELKTFYRGANGQHVGSYPFNITEGLMPYVDISDTNSVKSFINSMTKMIISIRGLETELYQDQNSNPCVGWNMHLHYNFESLSRVQVKLETHSYRCDPHPSTHNHTLFISPMTTNYTYCLVIFFLALTSLMLFILYFYRIGIIYQEAKVRYHAEDVTSREQYEARRIELLRQTAVRSKSLRRIIKKNYSWEDLTVIEKLSFISFWNIFGVVGNIFQMFGSASLVYADLTQNTLEVLRSDTFFVGFGCFFAWLQLMYYLEFSQNLIVLSTIIKKSLPKIISFYLFYVPLFIGFVLFCRAIFWKYPIFEDLGTASITLFSLQAGDVVYSSFQQVYSSGYARQLVLFIFVTIFYTAMQNIFFVVVLEGYELARIQKQIDNDDPWTNKKLVDVLSRQKDTKKNNRLSLLEEDLEEITEKAEDITREKRSKSAPTSPMFILTEGKARQGQNNVIEEDKNMVEFKEAMSQKLSSFRDTFKKLKRLKYYFLSSEPLAKEKSFLKMRYLMKLQEIAAKLNFEFSSGKFRGVVADVMKNNQAQ